MRNEAGLGIVGGKCLADGGAEGQPSTSCTLMPHQAVVTGPIVGWLAPWPRGSRKVGLVTTVALGWAPLWAGAGVGRSVARLRSQE